MLFFSWDYFKCNVKVASTVTTAVQIQRQFLCNMHFIYTCPRAWYCATSFLLYAESRPSKNTHWRAVHMCVTAHSCLPSCQSQHWPLTMLPTMLPNAHTLIFIAKFMRCSSASVARSGHYPPPERFWKGVCVRVCTPLWFGLSSARCYQCHGCTELS